MVRSVDRQTRKKLKDILDVTINIVVVLFAVLAIAVLLKNYFAPPREKTTVTVKTGSIFPDVLQN